MQIHFHRMFNLLLTTTLAGFAHGQDADFTLQDELRFLRSEMVVEAATKTKIKVSKAPGSITVIALDQIRASGARTIPEILRLVAGVNVRWSPMMQTISIRGFGQTPFTNRVLLLIDGVPYNSWNKGGFPQQPGFDFFPLENVKRLEVIRGPGSALYGENAYWGIINIVSLSGEDLDGGRLSLYGGDRDTRSGSVQWGGKFGEVSVLGSFKFLQSQYPLRFWFDNITDPKTHSTDIFLKADYKDWTVSYHRYDDELDGFINPFGNPNFPAGAAFSSADKIAQQVDTVAIKYHRELADGNYSVGADVSYARRKGSHCASCHGVLESPEFSRTDKDHGFQAIGDFRVGVHSIPNNDILFGIEVKRQDTKEHADELLTQAEVDANPALYNNAQIVHAYTKTALYVQDVISMFSDKLSLTLGARYDGKTSPDLFDSTFSPRIAAVYQATDKLTLRAGWSKAFRFPSFSELYQDTWFFNVAPGPGPLAALPFSFFVPNPDLKPEEVKTFELGAEYRLTENLMVKLDLFHSELDQFIVLPSVDNEPPLNSGLRFENHPNEAVVDGGELELRWDVSQSISGFINWSYKNPRQKGDQLDGAGNLIELVYASKNQFSGGAYFGPFAGISGALEMSWQDEYLGPSAWFFGGREFAPLEAFAHVNLRLNYTPSLTLFGTKDPLKLSFYLRNALDEEPEETVLPIDTRTPGREIFFGAEWRF